MYNYAVKTHISEGRQIRFYQQPLILTALLPDKRCLSHSMCLYQVMMTLHFLNDSANDAESTQNRK